FQHQSAPQNQAYNRYAPPPYRAPSGCATHAPLALISPEYDPTNKLGHPVIDVVPTHHPHQIMCAPTCPQRQTYVPCQWHPTHPNGRRLAQFWPLTYSALFWPKSYVRQSHDVSHLIDPPLRAPI